MSNFPSTIDSSKRGSTPVPKFLSASYRIRARMALMCAQSPGAFQLVIGLDFLVFIVSNSPSLERKIRIKPEKSSFPAYCHKTKREKKLQIKTHQITGLFYIDGSCLSNAIIRFQCEEIRYSMLHVNVAQNQANTVVADY